ncbi:hypothetical protein cypCar_00037165 [Cyprinus carpio]|nr:hypothetical protein cypCar_00037165 [Cyprinus carpio]
MINSGTVVFLDIVEKVRNTTEKLLRDDQFKKSRISVQGYMKSLREFAKPLNTTESTRGSQDNSVILPQYKKIYHETLKNGTVVDIWKTASGVIVFYWDKVLEHTESPSFHAKYLDSRKVIEMYFGEFFASQEYHSLGNAALGLDRFNQSNWAVVKSAVIYSLPVYEKLTKLGFGISEINRFLLRLNRIALSLEGEDRPRHWNSPSIVESIPAFILFSLGLAADKEKRNSKDNQLLLPLRVIRTEFLEFWSFILTSRNYGYWNETECQQIQRNFVQAIHRILEKLKQYTDLVDGFDERIDPTFLYDYYFDFMHLNRSHIDRHFV